MTVVITTTTTTQAISRRSAPFFVRACFETASAVDMMNVDSASAARRRRDRPLRQFLRHERLRVAMALSEKKHHTSRVRGWTGPGGGFEMYYTAKFFVHPLPSRSSCSCSRGRSPEVPGHPVWVSRGGRRRRSSSAPSSSSPTS